MGRVQTVGEWVEYAHKRFADESASMTPQQQTGYESAIGDILGLSAHDIQSFIESPYNVESTSLAAGKLAILYQRWVDEHGFPREPDPPPAWTWTGHASNNQTQYEWFYSYNPRRGR